MKLETRQFGEIEVDERALITFPEGIPGFEDLRSYTMLEEGDGVFYYLQSIEDGNIAFPIINPYLIKPDYAPCISEHYFQKLGGGESSEFTVFLVTTLREDVMASTVNLQAPLLIHTERKKGVQAIVEDGMYHSKHKVVDLLQERDQ